MGYWELGILGTLNSPLEMVKILAELAANGGCQVLLAAVIFLQACGSSSTPLDADTRIRIDSIANAEIAKAQVLQDSLCKAEKMTVLPRLVDSIRKVREREIEQQLKTVPK